MSVTSGGQALNPCSSGGRFAGSAGSAGISMTLVTFHVPFAPPAVAMPHPDRRGEILDRDHNAKEAVGFGRIVRRTQFEHHLLFTAEIQHLFVAALVKVPDMYLVSVFASQQEISGRRRSQPCSVCPTRW